MFCLLVSFPTQTLFLGWCTNKSYVIATSDLWLFIHASNLLPSTPHSHSPTYLLYYFASLSNYLSPWYNRISWLGVKHQLTYLLKLFVLSFVKSVAICRYSFYDGPPFATGLPHYGHILAGTIKDVVTRWAHMSGFYVERRFGWDCHGLPVVSLILPAYMSEVWNLVNLVNIQMFC